MTHSFQNSVIFEPSKLKLILGSLERIFAGKYENPYKTIWVPDNQVNSSYPTDIGSLLSQNEKIVDSCSVSVKYIGYSPIPANIEIPATGSKILLLQK